MNYDIEMHLRDLPKEDDEVWKSRCGLCGKIYDIVDESNHVFLCRQMRRNEENEAK